METSILELVDFEWVYLPGQASSSYLPGAVSEGVQKELGPGRLGHNWIVSGKHTEKAIEDHCL